MSKFTEHVAVAGFAAVTATLTQPGICTAPLSKKVTVPGGLPADARTATLAVNTTGPLPIVRLLVDVDVNVVVEGAGLTTSG